MIDFLMVSTRPGKRGIIEIYPRFIIKKSSDLMIRGGDFYAIWLEEERRWSTDEEDALQLIDRELDKFYEEYKTRADGAVRVLHMWDAETGMIDSWHRYCQKQMRDSFHMLDEKLIFSNMDITKKDYASKRLSYPLEDGSTEAYDKLMSTLYSEEERRKIEWCVGSVVSGDSKKIQKFMVLYGAAGTGKSTVLNIIQQLFEGYYSVFDAKSLGSSNNSFALEAFKNNPLVAIQHDGDLSKIEDNTRLNSLVSHETMVVNEKFKSTYQNKFKCFLFMGTNNPVKITDAKSGLMRRLIDVSPSGNKLSAKEYKSVVKQITFELGPIAWHCKQVYEEDPSLYDDYVPLAMLGASNDLYNFILDSYLIFKKEDGVTLDNAWHMYKEYCSDANVLYPLSKRVFKEQLNDYFFEYRERSTLPDGTRVRSYYSGFKDDIVGEKKVSTEKAEVRSIQFLSQPSFFDTHCCNQLAQYASENGTPLVAWSKVTTTLASIDTSKLHYVQMPDMHHIVVDFDIPDADGNKCLEKNIEEASKWPPTYAELSKSGAGIHLHYYYTGDPDLLNRVFAPHIEIKVFTGNSSLRRMLTKCNNLPIATISSGLPLKEEKKKSDGAKIRSQKKLLEMIERNLNKEIHGGTKPSCDFIYKIVEDAYADGFKFRIPNEMRKRIMDFAKNSTHQSDYCIKLMKKMHYQSKDWEIAMDNNNQKIRDFVYQLLDGKTEIDECIDKINEFLLNVYNNGDLFDVTDVKSDLVTYCTTYGKDSEKIGWCLSIISNMHFKSEDPMVFEEKEETPIIFYDIEVFPNVWFLNWKKDGDDQPIIRWINPTPEQLEDLCKFRLIGFNCRRYDNHIVYAARIGYTNEQLYNLSKRIVNGGRDCFFGEAYNLSYTDVYDFASAGNKKSLKKLEIEMGIHHQELGLDWDKPVPEDKWPMVAEYCDNDVYATAKAFYYLKGDWTARQILADLAGMTVNDTTNSLTTRIIFGSERNPHNYLRWRDLSKPVKTMDDEQMRFLSDAFPDMMSQTHGVAHSLLPYFPGYKYDAGVSTYRGEVVGEGGYVWADPGIHVNVVTYDVNSEHPHSDMAEYAQGAYTARLKLLVDARVAIKHEQWSKVDKMFDGKLKKYTQRVRDGEMTSKELANALKTAINSVYGLTAAKFDNPFRDIRNKDNIVAKRGALFMIDLKYAVQEMGGKVVHIKTDSIKIENPTPEIEKFILEFGKKYGYTFDVESRYEKMCLVNDAVYIAKTTDGKWTATGTQFAVPYVFKTLFSKEPYEFKDFCETKSVKTTLYLDMNENLPEGEHNYKFVGRVGQFCPVVKGAGGGILYWEKDGKYNSVTGTKGYRWLESEVVLINTTVEYPSVQDWKIDMSYYDALVNKAVETIKQYEGEDGKYPFEWFAS